MCKQCEISPVYEFTNKRKLCKNCFIKWFQKKFLYTIRKFEMLKKGDVVFLGKPNSFGDAVLYDLLKLYSEKGVVELKEIATNRIPSRFSAKKLVNGDIFFNSLKEFRAKRDNFPTKIAISSTSDTEADKMIHALINKDISKLKQGPVEKIGKRTIIKPLYLFLDKEVLLYAKLKRLKYKKINEKSDKISEFINTLEEKHPEIKQSIISSYGELFG